MGMIAQLLAAPFLCLAFPLADGEAGQQPDKWVGAYLNRETGVALQVRPKQEGMYQGEFTYNGMKLPIRGISLLGVFTAEYFYQQKWFSFTLTRGTKDFTLSVDGATVPMVRLPPGARIPVTPAPAPVTPNRGTTPSGGGGGGGTANGSWTQRLRGRQLLYLQTGGGSSTKAFLNLYPNGRFHFETSTSYTSGGFGEFSYADESKDDGTWKIIDRGGSTLLVTVSSKNGQTSEMRLQAGASATQVMVDGRRFFIRAIE
jgi:hypothetical protein